MGVRATAASTAQQNGSNPQRSGLMPLRPRNGADTYVTGRKTRVQSKLYKNATSPPRPLQILSERSLAPSANERSCGPEKNLLISSMAASPQRLFGSTMN